MPRSLSRSRTAQLAASPKSDSGAGSGVTSASSTCFAASGEVGGGQERELVEGERPDSGAGKRECDRADAAAVGLGEQVAECVAVCGAAEGQRACEPRSGHGAARDQEHVVLDLRALTGAGDAGVGVDRGELAEGEARGGGTRRSPRARSDGRGRRRTARRRRAGDTRTRVRARAARGRRDRPRARAEPSSASSPATPPPAISTRRPP